MPLPSISIFSILLISILIGVALFVFYRRYKNQILLYLKTRRHKVYIDEEKNENEKKKIELYEPVHTGLPSVSESLFMTNKGLRVFKTDVNGMPLPQK